MIFPVLSHPQADAPGAAQRRVLVIGAGGYIGPVVSVQMDYLDSTLRREVLALTDQGTVHADLVRGTLEVGGEIETLNVGRDHTYLTQHKAALAGGCGGLCTLAEGLDVMRMIDAAEEAVSARQWVAA